MKRAGLVIAMLSLAGCLEPGELSNADQIYDAIGARDSGIPEGGSGGGGSGGTGGSSGGMGGGGGMSGSGGTGGTGGGMNGECGDVIEDLIKPTCAGTFCHSTAAQGPLDLEADDLGSRLIGTESSSSCEGHVYIDAENPEQSLIYTKLSDPPPEDCGAQMPLVGDKLTDDQKACVLELIEQLIAEQ